MFEKLKEMYEDKTLLEMFKQGLITSKTLDYVRIIIWVDAEMTAQKTAGKKPKITHVITSASAVFDREILYCWRALAAIAPDRYKK